jgi:predicted O-methyltransferase YrrM
MSRVQTPITEELADYIRRVTVREPEVLKRQREETSGHPRASMQISPEQGQFLSFLARLIGARKTIEVGVFLGYSSICMAQALPADGRVVACDISREYTAIARRYWRLAGVENKIDLRLGRALDSLDALIAEGQAGTFDFAFIDADKTNYDNYYERALTLLRPGGVFAADNVLWHGGVIDPPRDNADGQAVAAFNRKLHFDERVWLTLAPIGDGLMVALKR